MTEGRRDEFAAFRAFADPEMRDSIPDPQVEATFLASKIDLRERQGNAPVFRLHRALLTLRRSDPVLGRGDRAMTRAAAIGARIVVVHRWLGTHRLLIANFGAATALPIVDSPVLQDLPVTNWRSLLSTDDARFGGSGRQAGINGSQPDHHLVVPARSAAIFAVAVAA